MRTTYRYLIEELDRHGNVRVYYRKKPASRIRIREKPGTEAFDKAYKAAEKGIDLAKLADRKVRVAAAKVDPGSLENLIRDYYTCGEFKQLSEATKTARRNTLTRLCADSLPGRPPIGTLPYKMMMARHVRQIRDHHADTPDGANAYVKALRQVFKFAIADDRVTSNPAIDVPYLESNNPDGHHSWTIEEVAQFEAKYPVGTRARLALALLLYTGQRRSDIILLGRQHVKNGVLTFTQYKGRKRKPVRLQLPIIPQLQHVIDNTPTGDMTFLTTEYDTPFTNAGFGNRFRDWCDDAGLPHCSAHGVRKATSSALAELNCTEHQIMSITGHTTSKEVARYTRAARQRVLAETTMAIFSAAMPSAANDLAALEGPKSAAHDKG